MGMADQMGDVVTDIESAAKGLPDGSVEKMLMVEAKASLLVAQSLVRVVNMMRLTALVNSAD